MKISFSFRSFVSRAALAVSGLVLLVTLLQGGYLVWLLRDAAALSLARLLAGICALGGLLALSLCLALRQIFHAALTRPLARLVPIIQDLQIDQLEQVSYLKDTQCYEVLELASSTQKMLLRVKKMLAQYAEAGDTLHESSTAAFATAQKQVTLLSAHEPSVAAPSAIMRDFLAAAQQLRVDVNALGDGSQQALELAKHGQEAVQAVVKRMHEIRHSAHRSAEKIMALSKQSEHINEVVSTIDRIIEDTKLIAFNATIEAARTKDEGRGFGVVAFEIKRLAEEVFESTEDIKELIHDIQHASHGLVLTTEEELKTVQRGIEFAEDAGGALTQIVNMITLTTDSLRHAATETVRLQQASAQASQEVNTTEQTVLACVQELKQLAVAAAEMTIVTEGLRQLFARLGGPRDGGRSSLDLRTQFAPLRKRADEQRVD